MKLLFDANLSPTLLSHFQKEYPESIHVESIGLDKPDDFIWEYAKKNNYTIVSKDTDFYDLINLFGYPPKLIWIRKGNCSTGDIIQLMRKAQIKKFLEDEEISVLVLK